MAFVGDGNGEFTDENLGGKFFANPKTVTTVQIEASSTRTYTAPVRTNLTNGQLWGVDPIPTSAVAGYEPLWDSDTTNYNAPLRSEPLWDSGDDNAPLRTEALWDSDETDANAPLRSEPLWDSDGNAWRPVDDLGSGALTPTTIGGADGGLSKASPNIEQNTEAVAAPTPSKPPTPPSTRPYIWKYQ